MQPESTANGPAAVQEAAARLILGDGTPSWNITVPGAVCGFRT
jgi:hypothetical protein